MGRAGAHDSAVPTALVVVTGTVVLPSGSRPVCRKIAISDLRLGNPKSLRAGPPAGGWGTAPAGHLISHSDRMPHIR